MSYIKALLAKYYIILKSYLVGGLFLLTSGLLVALRLKDDELHTMQVQQMQQSFQSQMDQENAKVEAARRAYDETN